MILFSLNDCSCSVGLILEVLEGNPTEATATRAAGMMFPVCLRGSGLTALTLCGHQGALQLSRWSPGPGCLAFLAIP